MSYTPHTWTVGDVITAERLNALEQGAASGGGGYDAEVYLHRESGSSTFSGTIVSGDFATLSAMIADDTPPSILVRVNDEYMTIRYSLSAVAIYYAGNSYINFVAPYINGYGLVSVGDRICFQWNSTDDLDPVSWFVND